MAAQGTAFAARTTSHPPDSGEAGSEAHAALAGALRFAQGWSDQAACTVGVSDRERAILSQADVPILVRNADIDQAPLREHVPDAYFTSATGSAGWAEGILGRVDA